MISLWVWWSKLKAFKPISIDFICSWNGARESWWTLSSHSFKMTMFPYLSPVKTKLPQPSIASTKVLKSYCLFVMLGPVHWTSSPVGMPIKYFPPKAHILVEISVDFDPKAPFFPLKTPLVIVHTAKFHTPEVANSVSLAIWIKLILFPSPF